MNAQRTGCGRLLFNPRRTGCGSLFNSRRWTFDDLFQEGFQGTIDHGFIFTGGTHARGQHTTRSNPFCQSTLLSRQGFDHLDGRGSGNPGIFTHIDGGVLLQIFTGLYFTCRLTMFRRRVKYRPVKICNRTPLRLCVSKKTAF